jgi:hypothetical protein
MIKERKVRSKARRKAGRMEGRNGRWRDNWT